MGWTKVVKESSSGKIAQEAATAILATTATNVVITDNESTSEANAIVFVADADIDGNTSIGLESDGTLTYNPSTGGIASTLFTGAVTGDVTGDITGDVTGNADTATLATNVTAVDSAAADATYYPALVDGLTGTQGIETESGLTYNPSTAMLTTAGFTGALTGNASTVTNGVYTSRVTSSGLGWVIDEDDMATDSATKVPTQQSVKKYVDDQILTEDSISELNDTTITGTPADNEVLAFNSGSPGTWINQTAAEAGLEPTITGGATTITSSNLTALRALVADGSGKVAVATVTTTELGYVSGVTSAIQTQMNLKSPSANPTFTGTATFSNIDVQGTTTTIDSANLAVTDPHIMINVLADQSDYTTGDSAIIFGHPTNSSGGKIVNVAAAGFKFTALHADDDPNGGTLVGEGSVTAGSLRDCYMNKVVLDEQGGIPTVINGGIYFDGADIYVGTD